MKEKYDFRLSPKGAPFVAELRLASVKNPLTGIEVPVARGVVGDSQYRMLEEIDLNVAQSSNKSLIAGWSIKRTYTASEIDRAQLVLLKLWYAAGAGEEYGTWYTDGVPNDDCAFERSKKIYGEHKRRRCALSSRQVGPLRFPLNKMRKGRDVFMTWGSEVVVSERLARVITTGNFTGAEVLPIWNTGVEPKSRPDLANVPSGITLLKRAESIGLRPSDEGFWHWLEDKEQLPSLDKALREQFELESTRRPATPLKHFFQLVVHSELLSVSGKTVFGESPLRPRSGESCSCGFGEVRGKRLLSPLSVIASTWHGSDINRSDLYVGGKGGLFRPWRLLVISKRLFDAMRQAGMKGYDFEVVEMV